MQCNERIVGSRRLDAVSLKERVTSENNRDGETYYPCERQTCYDVSRFYCTSLMIPTIRCVFKICVAEGCTRDRSCIHERSCEREETKKRRWENGKIEEKRVEAWNQSETRSNNEKREERGRWRIIEERGEGRIDRRVDIIINEQTTGSPLNLFETPYHVGWETPKKPWFLSSLFRPSSFCHRNTFSGILSITPERTANIIRTAASLTDRKIFLRSRILWCLFGVWVVCETKLSYSRRHLKIVICTFDPRYQLPILRFFPSYYHWSRGYLKASFVALWDLSIRKLIMNNPVWYRVFKWWRWK